MSCFVRKLEDIQFAVIEKERNQYFSSTWQLLLCYMILFIPPLSSPEVFNLIRSCQSWRGCLLLIGPWGHTFSFTVWQLFSMTLLTLWVCVCVCVCVSAWVWPHKLGVSPLVGQTVNDVSVCFHLHVPAILCQMNGKIFIQEVELFTSSCNVNMKLPNNSCVNLTF